MILKSSLDVKKGPKNFFAEFFPVPKLLEMRSSGLAITERYVHAVELVIKGSKLSLGRFGVRRIPEGIIKEGYVNDKQVVTDLLSSLREELDIEFVSVALPEEKAYLFKTEIPMIAKGNIREALELRLEENVPVPASEAVFDYMIIPKEIESENIDVSVTVLPSKVVSTYLDIIKSSGLIPLSFGVEAPALARALIPEGDLGTFMIVNIGETSTGLSIISRGTVQFSTTVQIGRDALTFALEKHFSVGTAEAKKIKEERGFVKSKENMELFFSLMNTISAIKDEMNKLLTYWQTHRIAPGLSGAELKKVILCGRDACLSGLDEYLSATMKVPVEVGNVWRNAFDPGNRVPAISFLDSLDFASAVGLALPEK